MKRTRILLYGVVTVFLFWGIAYGQPPYDINFDFYVGWQGGQRQTLEAASEGPYPGALFRSVKLEIPNRGVWLGAGLDGTIGDELGMLAQGWYFLSSNTDGAILLDPGATPRQVPASVSSSLDWWYVDVMGTHRVSGPFSVGLGLRLDHHIFYTGDPEILNLIFPLPSLMRFDLDMLSTIPYLGFQWGPSHGLTLRVLYSPLGWLSTESTLSQNNGVIRPQNWLGGKEGLARREFFELFGEYSAEVAPSAQLALFGRGTWLNGSSNATLAETLVNGSADYDVSYRRVGWTIGAKAAVLFDMPDFLNPW